ncbi:EAL domain-containing protein [Fusibacter sp. 3D3]|uniref:EAL domain-containing protein n=1 Tax=Fusibacter sp. 3D3 TaxID=1048380 RepID=UPI00085510C6|nr:EAL domain-containing protein [Fusibacter sp. 3D3]GAU77548.1 diguanylate cyclase/phosphodiesterase [Fusibacter sp. 3D3]
MSYKWWGSKFEKHSQFIHGFILGLGGVFAIAFISILGLKNVDDGRFAIITLTTLFYGPIAGSMSFLVMLCYLLLLKRAYMLLYMIIGVTLILSTTFMKRLFNKRKSTYAYVTILIIAAVNIILSLIVGMIISPEYGQVVEAQRHSILIFIQFILLVMLLSSIIKKEKSNDGYISALLLSKSDLEAQNEEIRALYEEMAATEEALQANYDELFEYRWKLEESEKRYSRVISASAEGFFDYYPVTKVWFVSNRFCNIFGFKAEESNLVTNSFFDRLGENGVKVSAYFESPIAWQEAKRFSEEIQILCNDDVYRWAQINAIAERDEAGRLMRITGSLLDINQRKIEQEKVEFYAFHDPVTGFLNEDYFVEAILRHSDKSLIILYVAIYDFNRLAMIYGSKITDIIQYQLGIYIHENFDDVITYSHIRAGVFGILLNDTTEQLSCIQKNIGKLNKLYKRDLFIGNYNINISLMFPYCINKKGLSIEEVMEHIEVTYEHCNDKKIISKLQGFSSVYFEDKSYIKQVSNYLFKAISEQLFTVVYQPQIENGKIIGVEALARLTHPVMGIIPPDVFIPIAEELGIVHEIDQIIITKSCKMISDLNKRKGWALKLSVNLSFLDLISEQIIETFIGIGAAYGLNNGLLSFEMTETAISKYIEGLQNNLATINKAGIKIELDDFGTGYSSLKYLGELPVEVIKIDKAFVESIEESDKMKGLVQLMINVGHLLNLTVVAEGIENIEQFRILEALNCDRYQGYYFSKPLDEPSLIEFVKGQLDNCTKISLEE